MEVKPIGLVSQSQLITNDVDNKGSWGDGEGQLV